MDKFREFGQKIKQFRQSRNISIDTVSSKTRISKKLLNILENGERKKFLIPVFMEGFLRNYLEAIQENRSDLIKEFRGLFLKEEEEKEKIIRKEAERSKSIKRRIIYISGAVLGAALIIASTIYIALNFFNTKNVVGNRVQTVQKPNFKSSNSSESVQKNIIVAKSEQKPDYFMLKIVAGRRSWIFYKIDNKTSNSGFIEAGKTMKLKAKNLLLATLGNSINMHLFFNGEKITIPKSVVHIQCRTSGCTVLSAREWQNIIFNGK